MVSQGVRALYKEVVEGKGSGLAGLHIKSTFLTIPFTTCSSYLILGGTGPPESARPQASQQDVNESRIEKNMKI